MNIIRYVNGQKIEGNDLSKYRIESDVILKTMKAVHDRRAGGRHADAPADFGR